MPTKNIKTVGSRSSVFHGNAKHTSGGLTKKDLKKNKNGEIVSRRKSVKAKRTESPLLAVWRSCVKKVSAEPRYVGKFNKLNKSGSFYKAVRKCYVDRLEKSCC